MDIKLRIIYINVTLEMCYPESHSQLDPGSSPRRQSVVWDDKVVYVTLEVCYLESQSQLDPGSSLYQVQDRSGVTGCGAG